MFRNGTHIELKSSLESIGASFAVYEQTSADGNFILISANTLYQDMIGIQLEYCLNKSLTAFLPRYIEKPLFEAFMACKEDNEPQEIEIITEYKESQRWWRYVITPVKGMDSDRRRFITTCIEITEKKILEKNLSVVSERFEAVVESAYDGIITIGENQEIKQINRAAKEILGIGTDVLGQRLTTFIPHRFKSNHENYVKSFRQSKISARPMQNRAPVTGLRSDGIEIPLEVSISKINVDNQTEMTAVFRDISEKQQLIAELVKQSLEDPLTGLPNRRQLIISLKSEIDRYKRFKHPISIVMFDVDHFKVVNDSYGHEAGDNLLKSISDLVKGRLRSVDLLARWGGEEFIIILPETNLEYAVALADQCRILIEESQMKYGNSTIKVTASFGVVTMTEELVDENHFIKCVDDNLYRAKQNGRNRVESSFVCVCP